MRQLDGCGLGNVFLTSGYMVEGEGADQTVRYADLDGLFFELARAVALRTGPLPSDQLRFLRKRMGMSQQEVGALCGKSAQAVAKWEKGQPVPIADGNLLRLAWLSRFSRRDLADAVRRFTQDGSSEQGGPFCLAFDGKRWHEDRAEAAASAGRLAIVAISTASTTEWHEFSSPEASNRFHSIYGGLLTGDSASQKPLIVDASWVLEGSARLGFNRATSNA